MLSPHYDLQVTRDESGETMYVGTKDVCAVALFLVEDHGFYSLST